MFGVEESDVGGPEAKGKPILASLKPKKANTVLQIFSSPPFPCLNGFLKVCRLGGGMWGLGRLIGWIAKGSKRSAVPGA